MLKIILSHRTLVRIYENGFYSSELQYAQRDDNLMSDKGILDRYMEYYYSTNDHYI